MLDLLISIVLLVLFLYVTAVYGYKYFKKVPTGDAAFKVKEWIINEFEELICKQPIEYNPTFDENIRITLLNALVPYNALESKYVYMDLVRYLGTTLPCILIQFIPKNGENDFDLIISIIKTVFYNSLVYRGFPTPLIDTTITKSKDNYLIWIVYATTPKNRKLFCEHFNNKAVEARKRAQQSVAPVIDNDLEKELMNVVNTNTGDKNE